MLDVISTSVLTVADRDIQPAARPVALRSAHAQQDVRREQRAEQHDFRGQEEPDADLGVVKAGVWGVLQLCRECPCLVRFVLGREIPGVARHAVFIWPAMHFDGLEEIAVRRRRGGLPFQGRGLPGIV